MAGAAWATIPWRWSGRWPPTAFESLVATGVAVAEAAHGHAVHVDATGLAPGTDYRYRFTVGSYTSTVGRTRTLAEGSPERFALAVVNCQMLEGGQYGAYRNLVDEDLDLVLHLGDYIYEYPGGTAERTPSRPARWRRSTTTGCGTRPTRSTSTSRPPTPGSRSWPPGTTTRWPTTTWATCCRATPTPRPVGR
ncbi:MAG: PhoD-like phosphatase N-terminal domain-containing protein [Acidimicrobiales bacterium]